MATSLNLLFNSILPFLHKELDVGFPPADFLTLRAVAAVQQAGRPLDAPLAGDPLPLKQARALASDAAWAARFATACYGTAGRT